MAELLAFPVPVDAETAVWAGPLFVAMALTGFVVLIWQAVRYFRDDRSADRRSDAPDNTGNTDGADRYDRGIDGYDPRESPTKPSS